MNERPTPETDAMIAADQHHLEDDNFFPATVYWRMCDVARTLERERDEAREAAEKAKAYKRVLKEDNAKLRRELDELNKRLIEVCQYGVVCTIEREDLRKEIAAERALSDRLAGVLFGCTARDQNDAYDAWKEARK